ncbi:MAG: nucleoside hydrolase [Verrucomicrobiota bacterium]
MKIHTLLFAAALAVLSVRAAEPVPVIFDTDMGNDIDDAMALVILTQLAQRGAVDILAVTSSKDHPLSAPYIDALNTYYGFPEVPIGAVRNGATPEEGRYSAVAKRKSSGGDLLYPHDVNSGEEVPDAVSLLREKLSEAKDGSVVLMQVGFFTNLARLLDSPPDDISEKSGKDLITQKVKRTIIMAGSFAPIRQNTRYIEYNVIKDIPSAQRLADDWPGELVWSGFEIGIASPYPWESIASDFDYLPNHLLKESYISWVQGKEVDRPTWDLSVVLHGAYPERQYFDESALGKVTVDDRGHTDFEVNKDGNDRYLMMSDLQAARVVEAYIQLCSEPPRP